MPSAVPIGTFWNGLEGKEIQAHSALHPDLELIGLGFAGLYEAAARLFVLPREDDLDEGSKLSARFLKRFMTDLRVMWMALSSGYTAPAAELACSLYEHAHAIYAICGPTSDLPKLKSNSKDDLPWTAIELAQIRTRLNQLMDLRKHPDKKNDDVLIKIDFEIMWREIYSRYSIFCDIKHPTGRSLKHGAQIDAGQFAVLAEPDLRAGDLGLKQLIGVTTLQYGFEILQYLSDWIPIEKESEEHQGWSRILLHVGETAQRIVDNRQPLPFRLSGHWLERELKEWKQKRENHLQQLSGTT